MHESSTSIRLVDVQESWVVRTATPIAEIFRLRLRQQNASEIWKRSFISTVRPTVHTDRSRKRSFWETLFKPEEFQNAGFAFKGGET